MKARHRRIVFFSILSVFLALILAAIIIPPMINLERMRPGFESALLSQTGTTAKINGRINVSLLGRAHVVAHDVIVPNGKIDSVMFTIRLSEIFDVSNAKLSGTIYVDGAQLEIQSLESPKIETEILLSNSAVKFMGKNYDIVQATLQDGNLDGWVRTEQHKYFIKSNMDEFSVTNKSEGLSIIGKWKTGGGANASLAIDTDDINSWFDFFEPAIQDHVTLTMSVDWDGGYGFKFSDIRGNIGGDDFTGSIELPADNGMRKIQIKSDKINFDLSFLLTQKTLLKNVNLDLDLRGNLKFANTSYDMIRLNAVAENDKIKIENLKFVNKKIKGVISGNITGDGAQNLIMNLTRGDDEIYCLFNGTPQIWRCDEYEYTGKNLIANGKLSVDKSGFTALLNSKQPMPESFDFAGTLAFLGDNGSIDFQFSNMAGKMDIINKKQTINYNFVNNKSLNWLDASDFQFLPESMRMQSGIIQWKDNDFSFIPENKKWELTTQGNFFYLTGTSALEFINARRPSLDLPFINDFPYEVSGNYSGNYITDLEFRIADHIFRGNVNGTNITLKCDTLNFDKFANKKYFDNYEEMQFLSSAPILAPFELGGINLSLGADQLIWNGEKYDNFVYSLRNDTQDFSITDDARGSLLVSLKARGNTYDLLIKLNRFAFIGKLLDNTSPLNISDSVVTGQTRLSTSGKIAYDFWRKMKGMLDLSFDGGTLHGIGTDAFYARAATITPLTAEDAIAHAISGGETKIKTLRIKGEYEDGKFQTTGPLSLSARHTEISGNLQLDDGKMSADINILMRGVSVEPKPVSLKIMPTGERNYSLSEIMRVIDPGYLGEFVQTHNQF